MPEDSEKIFETIKKRELDIEIMELELKHGLSKKRAEAKLTIMYYKACNTISKAKLLMQGFYGQAVKKPNQPSLPDPIGNNGTQEIDSVSNKVV